MPFSPYWLLTLLILPIGYLVYWLVKADREERLDHYNIFSLRPDYGDQWNALRINRDELCLFFMDTNIPDSVISHIDPQMSLQDFCDTIKLKNDNIAISLLTLEFLCQYSDTNITFSISCEFAKNNPRLHELITFCKAGS